MTLKQNILAALEADREQAISGQALAEKLGVSRNAIWKAVNTLRDEGYDIQSAPSRGYQLSPVCDRLSEGAIQSLMAQPAPPVHVLDSVDSTNRYARKLLAENHTAPFVVAAETQTAGRGRYGRSFYSPAGGLYLTVALAPHKRMESLLGFTACAAVCVSEAIRRATGRVPLIKWVNDLYFNQRKICGILTEAAADFESGIVDSLLIGIGINLRPAPLPNSLQDVIGFVGGEEPLKNRLAADIADGLIACHPEDPEVLTLYRSRSMTIGRPVRVTQGEKTVTGIATTVDKIGALVVRGDDGKLHTLRSGEVTVLNASSPSTSQE